MSLHQTNNVKDQPDSKTRTTIHPRFSPEIKAVRSYLATNSKSSRSTRGPEEPAAPCGEAAYMGDLPNRQQAFAILFQNSDKALF
jgi:hypothetical protein